MDNLVTILLFSNLTEKTRKCLFDKILSVGRFKATGLFLSLIIVVNPYKPQSDYLSIDALPHHCIKPKKKLCVRLLRCRTIASNRKKLCVRLLRCRIIGSNRKKLCVRLLRCRAIALNPKKALR
ncbi:MAG: hypothetical protein SGJ00_12350 [bacterium]|nr:hypothetical protein [bacterium]